MKYKSLFFALFWGGTKPALKVEESDEMLAANTATRVQCTVWRGTRTSWSSEEKRQWEELFFLNQVKTSEKEKERA